MYKFTEEQIMIRDMVREFTKNEVAPYDKAMDETFSFNMEIYQQIYSKLVETGLMGIHIPEQYGGGGGDATRSAARKQREKHRRPAAGHRRTLPVDPTLRIRRISAVKHG